MPQKKTPLEQKLRAEQEFVASEQLWRCTSVSHQQLLEKHVEEHHLDRHHEPAAAKAGACWENVNCLDRLGAFCWTSQKMKLMYNGKIAVAEQKKPDI